MMVDQFLIGGHRNFIYLISSDGQALVVDPQSDLTPWQNRLRELGAKLTGVLLTHTHWDHVAGVPAIVDQYGAEKIPIYVHELDARRMSQSAPAVLEHFSFVKEGDRIRVGSLSLEVLHTPGHSAGECCYYLAGQPPQLFTGDTVFVGDVGRTDLETGSTEEMFTTLQRLKKLAPETVIYPGHDYGKTKTTSIVQECKQSAAWRCRTTEELDAIP
ncbi:MAG: MBL fold metallo-hydrolase [Deltaproteobacteria bacterium]|nr:MBL fold metallo-hydrolase [Deltaproteobacteria bacterium]